MDKGQIISSIIISLVAAIGGWLTSRASTKASMKNATTSSRVEMEKEAYERARRLDTETINRQDKELEELRENQRLINADVKMVNRENERLHRENILVLEDNSRLRMELGRLRHRVVRLERGLHPDSTERIYERETDTNPMMRSSDVGTDPMMREILDNAREHDQ